MDWYTLRQDTALTVATVVHVLLCFRLFLLGGDCLYITTTLDTTGSVLAIKERVLPVYYLV